MAGREGPGGRRGIKLQHLGGDILQREGRARPVIHLVLTQHHGVVPHLSAAVARAGPQLVMICGTGGNTGVTHTETVNNRRWLRRHKDRETVPGTRY